MKTERFAGRRTLLRILLIALIVLTAYWTFNPSTTESYSFKIDNSVEKWEGVTGPFSPNSSHVVEVKSPGSEKEIDNWTYEINNLGFRNEDIRWEKENISRVMVLGASVTVGRRVNRTKIYTELLESNLTRDFPQDVEVFNAAVTQAGMFDMYMITDTVGTEVSPDVLVINLREGMHLSRAEKLRHNQFLREQFRSEYGEGWEEKHLEDYLIRRSQEQDRYYNNTGWNDSEVKTYGNKIISLAEKHGMRVILACTDVVCDQEVYTEWADSKNIQYVGPPSYFSRTPKSVYRFDDGEDNHFREIGHVKVADQLYRKIDWRVLLDE